MFHLMLTASIEDADEWSRTWEKFTEWSKEIGERVDSVHVSSHLAGTIGEDEEWWDENTNLRAIDIMKQSGLTDGYAREIVFNLNNAGIIFREKGPRS